MPIMTGIPISVRGRLRTSLLILMLLPALARAANPHLLAPNGAERFRVGSSATIRWEGTAPTDTVTLEYSTDNGITWKLITNRATGSQYVWSPIPNTPSDFCLMRISTGSSAGDSVLWLKHVRNGSPIPDAAHYAEFSPDGSRVIAGEPEGDVAIWDSFTGQLILTIPVESGAGITTPPGITLISSARYSPDGTLFATISPLPGAIGSMVRIFDAATGVRLRQWQRADGAGPSNSSACAFSPDGSKLVVTGLGGGMIYNVADGTMLTLLKGYTAPFETNSMVEADWRGDGAAIIGTSVSPTSAIPALILSDPASGDLIRSCNTSPLTSASCVRFSPDGSRFITTSEDGFTRVWDATSGAVLFSVKGYDLYPNWGVYSHDGQRFATAGQDNGTPNWKLRLYDAGTGALIRTVAAIGNGMRNTEFSPDDSRILVSCIDGVRIFHAAEPGAAASDVSDAVWSIYVTTGAAVTISLPRISARQGEMVDLPVTIDHPEDAIAAGASRIDVTLGYNVTLLDPSGSTPRGTADNVKRTIQLSLPLTSPGDTILDVLHFKAALGDDSTTVLELLAPTADIPSVTVDKQDGAFTLLDLCYQGGARLLNPNGQVTLRIIPSQSYVDVEVETIERGGTSLALVDVQGGLIDQYLNDEAPAARWTQRIDLRNLPTGRYFIVLRTPTILKTEALEVVR